MFRRNALAGTLMVIALLASAVSALAQDVPASKADIFGGYAWRTQAVEVLLIHL
jgi:hypothetical protein